MTGLPLLLAIASALASSFYEQPFPETVRNTPNIVRGKVGKSETQWTNLPEGGKHLFTYYDVQVTEGFKGGPAKGASIRIRELGGSKDGVSLNVSGTAGFEKGEDVVVMLGEANAEVDGAYPVSGMMMGKFNLEKGADGKEYLRGPGLGSAVHPGMRNEDAAAKPARISLEGLREIVRIQAAQAKASPPPSPAPKPPTGGLLSTNAGVEPAKREEIREEAPSVEAKRPEGGWGRGLVVFALGAAIGSAWFLKSRKKRR